MPSKSSIKCKKLFLWYKSSKDSYFPPISRYRKKKNRFRYSRRITECKIFNGGKNCIIEINISWMKVFCVWWNRVKDFELFLTIYKASMKPSLNVCSLNFLFCFRFPTKFPTKFFFCLFFVWFEYEIFARIFAYS